MTIVFSGLSSGALYVLTAVGFTIVFVSTGLFNFAQAQFMMAGTFVSYWTASQLHLPVVVGIPLGAVIGFGLGLIEEQVAIKSILRSGPQNALVTTIGFGVILDGIASLIWGTQPLGVPFFVSNNQLTLLGGAVLPVQLVMLGLAIVVPIAVSVWSRWTLAGLASLAAAEDREAATVRGINVRRFSLWSITAAAAFAGALGPLVGPQTSAIFNLGDSLGVTAFVVMALGGFGSYLGVMVSGLLVGVVEQESVRYLSAVYQQLIVFGLLIAVLMVRPAGLFKSHVNRAV